MAEQTTKIYRHDYKGDQPDGEPLRIANTSPPWRTFGKRDEKSRDGDVIAREISPKQAQRGKSFRATEDEARLVDAALVLRRPLLVEGEPGIGKTSLAYSVAWQLGLGDVFQWPITSRSTLKDALYQYDAIARLHAVSLDKGNTEPRNEAKKPKHEIGDYLTLGPLGSALVPNKTGPYHPRVLLVDEIDKSDIDLPNDLLHVLEEGSFVIPEIARLKLNKPTKIRLYNSSELVEVPANGRIVCDDFPFVVMTTNGEREFSPAFKRRCLPLRMERPDGDKLKTILKTHLGDKWEQDDALKQLSSFLEKLGKNEQLAVDQLLNAVYLTHSNADVNPEKHTALKQAVLQSLSDSSISGD